jgi:hypothetical protein
MIFMKKWIVLVTLSAFLLCVSCRSVSTSTMNIDLDISDEITNDVIKTLAVLRFDDEQIRGERVRGFLVKAVKNPDPGGMLADIMTTVLSEWDKYNVLTRSEVKDKVKTGGTNERDLVKWKDYAAAGKVLKVDAVIIGKVNKFGLVNTPFYVRGHASFKAECIDTKSGNVIWSIEANESASYDDEVDLALKIIKEAVERLKREI